MLRAVPGQTRLIHGDTGLRVQDQSSDDGVSSLSRGCDVDGRSSPLFGAVDDAAGTETDSDPCLRFLGFGEERYESVCYVGTASA